MLFTFLMTTIPTLSLSATDIYQLIFGADELPTRPFTLLHAADDIFRQPKILTVRLGKLIISLQNPFFTVFLFDTHAELWITKHWNESVSKRITQVANAHKLKEQIRVTDECLNALLTHPLTGGLALSALYMFSWAIRHDSLPPDMVIDLELTDIHNKFRGVSLTPPTPSTPPSANESNRQQDPAV